MEEGSTSDAISYLEKGVREWPENEILKLNLAFAYYQIRRFDEAEKLFNEMTNGQWASKAYFGLGEVAKARGKDGRDFYERCFALEPAFSLCKKRLDGL